MNGRTLRRSDKVEYDGLRWKIIKFSEGPGYAEVSLRCLTNGEVREVSDLEIVVSGRELAPALERRAREKPLKRAA